MPRFRKKPVVIEARQFDGSAESRDDIFNWLDQFDTAARTADGNSISIDTLEGVHRASPGDWIIRVKNEFYPCKPDIFAATYERCDDSDA